MASCMAAVYPVIVLADWIACTIMMGLMTALFAGIVVHTDTWFHAFVRDVVESSRALQSHEVTELKNELLVEADMTETAREKAGINI